MKTISLAWLNEHGACTGSRIWFEEKYENNDVELTKEGLETVPIQSWLEWLALELNPKAFDRARKAYYANLRNKRTKDLAGAAYIETIKDIILTR